MLDRIAQKFSSAKLYGVDASSKMIEFASKQYQNYVFDIANAGQLPYKNNMFDVVTNAISMHHYNHPGQAIAEAFRVLKPGGQFALMDITPKYTAARKLNDFGARYVVRDGHVAFIALSDAKDLFSQAGFMDIEQYFVGFPGVHITCGIKPSKYAR